MFALIIVLGDSDDLGLPGASARAQQSKRHTHTQHMASSRTSRRNPGEELTVEGLHDRGWNGDGGKREQQDSFCTRVKQVRKEWADLIL